jgi:hypothetical protein
MRRSTLWVWRLAVVGVTLGTGACTHVPTSPATAVPIVTAKPALPAGGTQISFYAQPITLSVTNGGAAVLRAPVVDTFQVATDAAFASLLVNLDVPQSSDTTTSLTLPSLAPSAQYFWRVRSTRAGGADGPFSAPLTFIVGPRVFLGMPVLVQPLAGGFVTLRPTFVVANATRTGPAGSVAYQFDVSMQSSFSPIVVTGTVPEGAGQTSFAPTTDLTAATGYFWRVQATDTTNHEAGPASTVGAFATPVVGSATLTLHSTRSCTLDTDIRFAGTASLTSSGWSFRSAATTFSPFDLHLTLTAPVSQTGTLVGQDMGLGLHRGSNFLVGMYDLAQVTGVSFGSVGVTGSLGAGRLITGNQFDGPLCDTAGFTWQVTTR